jgi:fructose-bisphosphate aldolase class II
MSLVTLKQILDEAMEGGYAVPAFDVVDHASAEGVVLAAEKKQVPVILMFPEAALPLVDEESYFPFLVNLAKNAKVPVALELDHGQKFETIMKAIHYGFSSVMIDGSSLPHEENIALTKKVVEVAHAAGVSVEAEIGHVGGGEGSFEGSEVEENMYTKPEDALYFAQQTGVDALAIAFGTVHGVYRGTPKLDFERLQKIREMVKIPLVMHGGSGVAREDFVKAATYGINKINLFTEISMAAVHQSVAHAEKKQQKLHFAEMVLVAKKTVEAIATDYLTLFRLNK